MANRVIVFDFDQTIGATDFLKPLRDKRDWAGCKARAGSVPFFEGIVDALVALKASDASLFIASSAPRQYLIPFISRLPPIFEQVLSYRSPQNPGGLSRRAAIKVEQINEISRYADKPIWFVGDDADDASAARACQVPFAHACWGGSCASIQGTHITLPPQLLNHLL